MDTKIDLTKLIHKGGVFEIDAKDSKDAFRKIADTICLPNDIQPDLVYKSLCEREAVLTTAVGNGIALPHARSPIFADENEQRICLVYLKNPIDMKAPDLSLFFSCCATNLPISTTNCGSDFECAASAG